MKKISLIGVALLLLLSGCAPKLNSQEENVQKTKDDDKKSIIPKYKISDEYYRIISPLEVSKARGQVVSNLNSRYDVNEMEMGLMRIAQEDFDTDEYIYNEGQNLTSKMVNRWLQRKYTKEQFKELMKKDSSLKESDNIGLNPVDPGKGDIDKRNKENPLYLAHILEQDYLVKKSDDEVSLGGVVIGLALNSTHYYQKEEFGAVYETKIDNDEIVKEGKKIADEVLSRLRSMDKLKNVPITIALYKQAEKSSVVPGNFFAYAKAKEGSSSLSDWKKIDEKYYLFPSEEAGKKHRDDNKNFLSFKQEIEKYYPNFNGVIGRGYYLDDQLQKMKIEIPIQFYGKAESIGFTQLVASKVMEFFPDYINVQVEISSVDGPESIIVRNTKDKEPFVHIYE
ncbi:CamS family sex pheromone protein [Bacillus testis]|uniref:CamS family sex pheromone protein n=1 Tax=Bacillus testis TaxID=1622072 RepID=UPI00067EC17D|nr:CamS family sex pheromone protein [Bacillus testis]